MTHRDHRDALCRSFPYLHIFGAISSILFGLSTDALSTIAFCVDCPVHLSTDDTSVVKTDSEGWTVFLGRRIVLPFLRVSSPDCNQSRTGLVTAGRQRMRVVAGSAGATTESTSDCTHFTILYYIDSVLSCAYNQPMMPEDALCSNRLRLNKPPKTNMHRVETPGIGAKKTSGRLQTDLFSFQGPFSQTLFLSIVCCCSLYVRNVFV